MRILIFGASGMLGHRLWLDLGRELETWGTVRSTPPLLAMMAGGSTHRLVQGIDVQDPARVGDALRQAKPDVVVNCVGLIKQREASMERETTLELNARFPHRLLGHCRSAGARMIQISTDCVFSGRRGSYREDDPADPDDLYGQSKLLGEIVNEPDCLTLRTSIIGHELQTRYGLVEWFLSQSGAVHGYQRAIFSGFTSGAFADLLLKFILPRDDLRGVLHVSSSPLSKYDLLHLLRDAYHKETVIKPSTTLVVDRSLDSDRLRQQTGFSPPAWEPMIAAMAASYPAYQGLS